MSINQDGTNIETGNVQGGTSSIDDGDSQVAQSRHGSITHPYRTLLNDTSFARCHPVTAPTGSTEAFIRSLLTLGNGTPLWDPIGNVERPKQHVKSSIMIGDVGYFDTQGDFSYYFNIFLPPTDPTQHICPPSLEPLVPPLEPEEVVSKPKHFSPGTTLVSPGVEVSRISTSPLDVRFAVKAREGGILILPDGASREDLVSTARIREYVLKHALSWYTFINEGIHRQVICSNGSLCIVTGHDKATAWAASVSLGGQAGGGRLRTIRYQGNEWVMNTGMVPQTSAVTAEYDIDKCAVFLRTMRVAVSTRDWIKHLLRNEPPQIVAFYYMPVVPVLGFRAFYQSLKERLFKNSDESVSDECTELTFHPLEVVLQFLLEETPASDVAIVEDSLWSGVASETDGSLSNNIRALTRFIETHEISSTNGHVTLIPSSSTSLDGIPASKLRKFSFNVPSLVKREIQIRGRRREIAHKLSKIFPGPGIPVHFLGSETHLEE